MPMGLLPRRSKAMFDENQDEEEKDLLYEEHDAA